MLVKYSGMRGGGRRAGQSGRRFEPRKPRECNNEHASNFGNINAHPQTDEPHISWPAPLPHERVFKLGAALIAQNDFDSMNAPLKLCLI